MASVVNRPGGHRWVQFSAGGKRHTVRLGVVSRNQALEVKFRVERILGASRAGSSLDPGTADWLSEISPDLHRKLAKSGLVSGRANPTALAELIAAHGRSVDHAKQTQSDFGQLTRCLVEFFRGDSPIAQISPADADEFRVWLYRHGRHDGGPLADTTASRRCRRARELFQYAIRKKWLAENPLAHQKGWVASNREKDFFVDSDLTSRIFRVLVDVELRTAFALVRYAALRFPSEVIPFRWEWIDWEADTLHVRAPKNKRYEGHRIRNVPLFAELRPYLNRLFDLAPDGSECLFPRLQQLTGTAVTDRVKRKIKLAGIDPWPKLWTNLRATRETELLEKFPAHTVVAWVGHSLRISQQHYAQVVKDHHARAVSGGTDGGKQKAKHRQPITSRRIAPKSGKKRP